MALTAALLGWMFDGFEMGLFPLVSSPGLGELLGARGESGQIGRWFGIITASFLIGAATGGVLFGWLGDKIGRIRALTISVLVYALCSGLCLFVSSPEELVVLRFLGALGMGGEWALGVALIMEMWPKASRMWLAALIGAFGNLGFFAVGLLSFALNRVGGQLPESLAALGLGTGTVEMLTRNSNWRLLMLLGTFPALLTLFIRLYVPESPRWAVERNLGKSANWSTPGLLVVLLGATLAGGIVFLWSSTDWPLALRLLLTLLGFAAITWCFLFPVRSFLRASGVRPDQARTLVLRMLLAAALAAVPLLGTWAGVMWVYNWVDVLTGRAIPDARPVVQMAVSLGASIGGVIGAVLGWHLGRRAGYAILCLAAAVSMLAFFRLNTGYGWELVCSAGVLGCAAGAFYGWLPLYLPELFPTDMRASGQGFGFNFGRIIAAIGTVQVGNLLAAFDNDYARACSLVAGVYIVGLGLALLVREHKFEG